MILRWVLLATCWIHVAVAVPILAECEQKCSLQVPNGDICKKACELAAVTNATGMNQMPTPDPPRQASATFFGMTLEWSSYRNISNATPLVYVLEVTRHMGHGNAKHINSSDPTLILPILQKYHMASDTKLTLPDELTIKTAYSFRVAVVTLNRTSALSDSSELYQTNSSCLSKPCPISNLRLHVVVQRKTMFAAPTISTFALWDRPQDFANFPKDIVMDIFAVHSNPGRCNRYLQSFYEDLNQTSNRSSELPDDETLYFGCVYEFNFEDYDDGSFMFPTAPKFFFPHCFQGFCGCEPSFGDIPKDSIHISVDVKHNGTSSKDGVTWNVTSLTVTWATTPWDGLELSYFRITLSSKHPAPSYCGFQSDHITVGFPTNVVRSYSHTFYGVCENQEYVVHVKASNNSGCVYRVEEGLEFTAVPSVRITDPVGTVTTAASSLRALTSVPGTSPRHDPQSAKLAAAITVPLVGLLLGAVLLVFYFRCRRKKAPSSTCRRTPTGLQRANTNGTSAHVYMRNVGDSSVTDRGMLVVDLPQKCANGGLELNPAYVEQRIHEATETGEADDFEFGYHRLELGRVLGKGAFGKVYQADAYGISGSTGRTTVAIKVLKENAHEDEVEDFKTEISFMKTIGHHQNVVTMLGCCTLFPPLCLIVEYIPYGDLARYLKDLRKKFEQEFRKRQSEGEETGKQSHTQPCSTSDDSINTASSFSRRPLVPSLSDTATLHPRLSHKTKHKTPCQIMCWSGRRPLIQSNSEPPKNYHRSEDSISFEKFDKFFEPEPCADVGDKTKRFQRTTSNSLAKGLASILPLTKPLAHQEGLYVGRDEQESSRVTGTSTDPESWNSQTSNTHSRAQAQAIYVDGALDSSDLQSFAYQIANGMTYLSEKGIVHRDLAARNILVGDEKILKISDFGLSKDGTYVKNSTGKIPLRWLSVEAMRDRFYSTASDVWAFGIVLWEICTLGGFPYPTVNDRDLMTFLAEGNRMDKPSNCTDAIYEIMLACWSRELDSRPSFQALREILWELEKEDHPYVNVDPAQDFILPPDDDEANQNLIVFSDNTVSLINDKESLPTNFASDFPSLTDAPNEKSADRSKNLSTLEDVDDPGACAGADRRTSVDNHGFRGSTGHDDVSLDIEMNGRIPERPSLNFEVEVDEIAV